MEGEGESPPLCVGLVDIRGVLLFGDRGEMVAARRARRHGRQLAIDWSKETPNVAAETARVGPAGGGRCETTTKPANAYKPVVKCCYFHKSRTLAG